MKNLKNITNNSKGFVLLYAVLVAGVVSIGGVLLSNIIYKQLILSSIGRESQVSYYAANAGKECAIYWNKLGAFGIIIDDGASNLYIENFINPINCNNQDITVHYEYLGAIHKFSFDLGNIQQNSEAKVEVIVNPDADVPVAILSKGYNIDIQSPRLVERFEYTLID